MDEFRYRSKDKAKDIMPLIIRGLRIEKVALGTANSPSSDGLCNQEREDSNKDDEIDNDERKFR